MLRRILTVLYVFMMTGTALAVVNGPAYAQNVPNAIIDAAFKDLNARLGTSYSRTSPSNSTFTWEQDKFGTPALGCPAPGQMYPQLVTDGYKIIITANGVSYDYRALLDGSVLFQCSPAGVPVGSNAASAGSTLPPTVAAPVVQSRTYSNPLAYSGADGNIYVMQANGAQGSMAITANAKGPAAPYYPFFQIMHRYRYLRWSPDGMSLAFVEASTPGLLYVARSGQAAQVLARGIFTGMPPFWLSNSQEIGYLVPVGVGDSGGSSAKFQIQAIAITGGSPRALGDFNYQPNCGGGGFDPMQAVYYNETGLMGNGPTLYNTVSGGYVFSLSCTGIGLGFSTGSAVSWQRPDLGRAALSPDGRQLIAVRFDISKPQAPATVIDVEKVDISTGQSTPVTTQAGVDQLGWLDNSTLVYSTLTAATPLNISATLSPDMQAALGMIDATQPLTNNTITLWKLPIGGGSSTQLYSGSGVGIGQISRAADGSQIVVSLIPSMASVVTAVNANPSVATIQQNFTAPTIITISATGQVLGASIPGGQPAQGQGSFVAVGGLPAVPALPAPASSPVPSSGQALPTPALVIGGQAIVTVTGDALNLRVSPTRAAQVLRLVKAGVVVTVVGGPASADGLRWWQIKLADGTSGWAADQVSDSSGTTNTLTPQ